MKITRRSATAPPAFKAYWRHVDTPKAHVSLALSGRISYVEAPRLREILFEMIYEDGPSDLVVELGALETIDTAAVAVLVEGLVSARSLGQQLLLCEPGDSVRSIFQLAGLLEALNACCRNPGEIEHALLLSTGS